MALWELNPEVLGSLWQMACATFFFGGGGITLAEGLHIWGRRAVPILNYTLSEAENRLNNIYEFSPYRK
jgi:hypothetical protein